MPYICGALVLSQKQIHFRRILFRRDARVRDIEAELLQSQRSVKVGLFSKLSGDELAAGDRKKCRADASEAEKPVCLKGINELN